MNTLDFNLGIGQRSTTYRFNVIDGATGAYRGEIHPIRSSTPSLSHDVTSTIPRRLQGVTLAPDEVDLFRPLIDRIELTMLIDGVGEYPLGRYVASDDVQATQSDGMTGTPIATMRVLSLYDEMFVIDQKLPDSFASGNVLISEVIKDLLRNLPIIEPRIDGCSQTSNAGWSAGTSRASVLKDLCTAGGYFTPWFDHTGTLRCIQSFDPALAVPTIDFDIIPRVMRKSITITDESLSAPNRFVVISNDTETSDAPIVGTWDVPATAPNSILNRGFIIPDVRDIQVTSVNQAQVYARTIGIQETIVTRLECTTIPDPRHDSYDVIRFLNENWLEIGWTITLSGNGTMRHTLSRTYSVSDEEV